jgi:hypothetical protein
MQKPFQTLTNQTSRLDKYLYEVKMFFLMLAYVAALGLVTLCVMGAMLLALVVTILHDLVKNWSRKYLQSPA